MPNQREDVRPSWIKKLLTIGACYLAMNLFMLYVKNKTAETASEEPDLTVSEAIAAEKLYDEAEPPFPEHLRALWTGSQPFTLTVDVVDSDNEMRLPVWDLELSAHNFSKGFSLFETVDFALPKALTHRNGSLYAHVALQRKDSDLVINKRVDLSSYLPKKKVVHKKLLLSDEDEEPEEEDELPYLERPLVPNIYPNVSIGVIYDLGNGIPASMPPVIQQHIISSGDRDSSGKVSFIYPIVFNNEFWQLNSKMVELGEANEDEQFALQLNLYSTSFFMFQMLTNMDHSFKEQARQQGGRTSEVEQIKVTLLESNPYLLAITAIVSVFHMLFEFLAFKSDISHWKNKKDTVGVSVRSIIANVVMQSIIFLYLMDNNEDTSYMIMLTQGMGILVEAWKINKVAVFTFFEPPKAEKNKKITNVFGLGVLYIQDRNELSEIEERTKEYDSIAFKYLYIAAVPLIGAYAVYSVMYVPHKSWYSFIISTLVGSVYAYGFLMLVPSIYINYRLKSVAHMPRKAMIYKFLNTFIDDLFAFVVKMPLLHRIATLRDDVIFFVYIYQTWVYRVDYTRVNEFGQGGDDEAAEIDDENKEKAELVGREEAKKVNEITASATGVDAQEGVRRRN
ncbi:Cleft lip and palate transmembrane protein 1-like protein [Yarrowia sp. B02]|nr:Cleft lip and palate transmembrane protein 1-like protein [Yarrowia sp. B02]